MYCKDLFKVTEEMLIEMNVKFGHRKKILTVLKKLNIFESFLEDIHLTSHKEYLEELGFDSVFSIRGVKPEYAEKMQLSEEEMNRWIEKAATMVSSKVEDCLINRISLIFLNLTKMEARKKCSA